MKTIRRILKDVRDFIVVSLKANLGISGEEWNYDGASTMGWTQATIFNCLVALAIGLTFVSTLQLPIERVLFCVFLSLFYSFVVVGFLLPWFADYLEISLSVKGLTEEQTKKIYGREMRIIENN